MFRFLLYATVAFVIGVLGYYYFSGDSELFSKITNKPLFRGTIDVNVNEFTNGGLIPKKFTCEGSDIHPSLLIQRVPEDAVSLVLIVDEPDTSNFTHYILYNIDPNIESLDQGVEPLGSVAAVNDFGNKFYNGPCPEFGTHMYYFRIYALNTTLNLNEDANRAVVDKMMKGHIIAQGEFTGEYSKN